MRPLPPVVLITLIAALCGLCAWQWHRESELRAVAATQSRELDDLNEERQELEGRAKAADAEILRLTGALTDLRATSVSAAEHTEATASIAELREAVSKRNTVLTDQDVAIATANESIVQANATIKKLTAERDSLAGKVNDVTARYNKLANPN